MTKSKREPEYDYLLPPEECERAYKILGREPDLDPCGHPDQFLKAGKVYYGTTSDDDGMLAPWVDEDGQPGMVILNASHGERTPKDHPGFEWYPLSRWIMKAAAEAEKGATVLALLPANTDRVWFHNHVAADGGAASVCLLEKRVKNYAPDRTGSNNGEPIKQPQPMQPHMWVLWTKDKAVFERFYTVLGKRDEAGARLGFVTEPNPVE